MRKTYDLVTVGECLVDMVQIGTDTHGAPLYSANAGGAPANVAAMAARLGSKTAFIGKVGYDRFGMRLRDTLAEAGIETRGMLLDARYPTTLAFVQLSTRGERSFTFYRDHAADVMLEPREIPDVLVTNTKILHFGGVSLTHELSRAATLHAVTCAKAAGAVISYDPNYRPLLWRDEETARETMLAPLSLADVVKVSDEELFLLTDCRDILQGAELLSQMGPSLILVTMGEQGAFYYHRNACGLVPAYTVDTVDTTGAGDAFIGCMLWQIAALAGQTVSDLTEDTLTHMTRVASAAGALATTAHGAIPAMPTYQAIEELVSRK